MPKNDANADRLFRKLDEVKLLLQDLLIVEGIKAGVQKQALRKVIGVNMNRVTRFSKAFESGRKSIHDD